MKMSFATLVCLVFVYGAMYGQQVDVEIARYVRMLEEGKADQVKAALPSLVSRHQNHPGVLYLQGRLASDGAEAVKSYQSIVDNFPQSEWADDALYHIYQYYYALGLYRTAELKMAQLRKDYPNSPYITGRRALPLPEEEDLPLTLATPTPIPEEPEVTTPPTPPVAVPVRPAPIVPTPAAGVDPYAVQVGAFSTMQNAEKLKVFFEDLGYRVEVQNKVRGDRSLYLVWVGSFRTAEQAREFSAELKRKHNIESIIVTR